MTANHDGVTTTADGVGLRVMSALYRAAAVELLIREYHWRGGAAERFAALLAVEVTNRAERLISLRRELAERAGNEITEIDDEPEPA